MSPSWGRVSLAVFLAGTMPIVVSVLFFMLFIAGDPQNRTLEQSLAADFFVDVLTFLLHLILPLVFGLWAGFSWPGSHKKGNVFLGLATGAVALITMLVFSSLPTSYTVTGFMWGMEPSDVLLIFGAVCLFSAGGLFADLVEKWRNPNSGVADAVSPPGREPSKTTLALVQAIGPTTLTLIGTIFTGIVALYR